MWKVRNIIDVMKIMVCEIVVDSFECVNVEGWGRVIKSV